jgi:hypothetical protein
MRDKWILAVLAGLFCLTCFGDPAIEVPRDPTYSFTSSEYDSIARSNAFIGAEQPLAQREGNPYLRNDEAGGVDPYANPFLTESLQPSNEHPDPLWDNMFGAREDVTLRAPGQSEDFSAEYNRINRDYWNQKVE